MSKAAVNVFDVAACILKEYAPLAEKHGVMTALKLQKLVYYSQAWSLVFDKEPLFGEPINAWKNGPFVCDLFKLYQGRRIIRESKSSKGDPEKLNEEQRKTIDFVLRNYGSFEPAKLKNLVLREAPWIEARKRLDRKLYGSGRKRVDYHDMAVYYASLNLSYERLPG